MKLNYFLLTILLFANTKFVNSQSLADCNNMYLDIDTVYLFPGEDTLITGNIFYNDTTITIYPFITTIIPENPYIESTDLMVLSFLDSGFVQFFDFDVDFISTDFPNNTIIQAVFHIYDADLPGDSIVTCYLPFTLILPNKSETINSSPVNNIMQVYPNPVKENLHISLKQEFTNQQIQILNYSGQLIETLPAQSELNLNLTSYASGIYYIKFENSGILTSFVKE